MGTVDVVVVEPPGTVVVVDEAGVVVVVVSGGVVVVVGGAVVVVVGGAVVVVVVVSCAPTGAALATIAATTATCALRTNRHRSRILPDATSCAVEAACRIGSRSAASTDELRILPLSVGVSGTFRVIQSTIRP